ncbi:MAG: hypothetical protein ACI83P_000150 [Janthinobacterium sp.]|jgi:hypothetical protein
MSKAQQNRQARRIWTEMPKKAAADTGAVFGALPGQLINLKNLS